MSCLVILILTSLRVCGECSAASTRDAGCIELDVEVIEEDDEQALAGDEEEDMFGGE